MPEELDPEFIAQLLKLPQAPLPKSKTTTGKTTTAFPPREQWGPLRRYDRSMRCASRGCGAETLHRLDGIPRCIPHASYIMNDMLFDLTKLDSDKDRPHETR